MALFKKLFSSKLVANSDVIPAELNDEQDVNNENQNPVGKTKDDESKTNLITIKWGTGLPIDVIFHYIHKNFEEEGFHKVTLLVEPPSDVPRIGIIFPRRDTEIRVVVGNELTEFPLAIGPVSENGRPVEVNLADQFLRIAHNPCHFRAECNHNGTG